MIKIENLVHNYTIWKDENTKSEKTVLDGISLDIPSGQFVAILGPNGSGKSTLARHLNVLLLPDEGTALAGLPECLVLDEPTAMLDPSSRKEVINIVKELNQKEGMTIILITHHTDEVVDADRIILMKDGKIIGDDIPKKIFADRSLLKRAKMDIPPVVELGMWLKKQKIGLDEPVLHEQEMIRKITELYRSKCGGWKDAAR